MITRELREPDYWINRAEKAEAALAEATERPVCDCHTWPTWSEMHGYIEALEHKLAECEREKELSQQGLCDYNKHRLLDNEERFCYWRDKIVPKMQEQIADLSRKLAAAREVINAAQQSIEFSNHVTSVKCWHCTKQSKLREALAALTEAGEGEK